MRFWDFRLVIITGVVGTKNIEVLDYWRTIYFIYFQFNGILDFQVVDACYLLIME